MFSFNSLFRGGHEFHVAQQDRAHQATLVEQKADVVAVRFLVKHLTVRAFRHDLTDAEQIQAEHLERIGAGQAAEFRTGSGQIPAGNRALGLGGGPESVHDTLVLGHVAGGQDIGMRSRESIVDHHAVFDFQSGLFRQRTVGPDAGGNHHQVRRDRGTVLQQNTIHPFPAEDLAGHGILPQRYADPADMLAQNLSSPLVQLAWQEPPVTFQESHLAPRWANAPAVSKPRIPPPIQTQRAPAWHASSSKSASWTVRTLVTPVRSEPGIGGMNGFAPAAKRSLSKRSRLPLRSTTAWSCRSRRSTSSPSSSSIFRSAYQRRVDGQVLSLDFSREVTGQVQAIVGEFRLPGNQGDLRQRGGIPERLHGGNPRDPGANHHDARRLARFCRWSSGIGGI